jgi:hypothetical protein
MTIVERGVGAGLCLLGVLFCLSLLSKRKLTFPFALLWIVAFLVGGAAFAVLPYLVQLSVGVAGLAPGYEFGVTVLGAALICVLLYLSVRISVLTQRFEELAQKVAISRFDLEEQIARTSSAGADRKDQKR